MSIRLTRPMVLTIIKQYKKYTCIWSNTKGHYSGKEKDNIEKEIKVCNTVTLTLDYNIILDIL